MRITNSMLVTNLMKNLNTNLTRLDKLQNQMATGRKFPHISDDPIALIYSQAARNRIARLSHYQGSVGSAQDWLNQTEVGLMELQARVVDAYDLTVDAATDAKLDEDRVNISAPLKQIRDQYVDTLNTAYGNKFVFGGYNTPGEPSSPPFSNYKPFEVMDTGTGPELYYNGFNLSQFDGMTLANFNAMIGPPPNNAFGPPGLTMLELNRFLVLRGDILEFDVGPGIPMPVAMNGVQVALFTTTDPNGVVVVRNTFDVLQYLCDATEFGSASGFNVGDISDMIKPLQDSQNHLLTLTAEVGGRLRRLDMLEARYELDSMNYREMLSNAEDVDMADVLMNIKMAEAVYQASLSAGARVIQPTLMDFLR